MVNAVIDPAARFQPPPDVPASAALPLFSRAVDGQAAMLATNDFYAWATFLILVFAALIWLAKKPKGPLKQGAH